MGRFWNGLVARGPDPVLVVELLQSAKTALAGVVAWVVATNVLGLQQPFLAPWSAVLVVHSTVYRSLSRGGQQVVATFAGVFLAWGSGTLFGVSPTGMGVMLVAAFLVGRHRWLRDETTSIATTGIVVMATYAIAQSNLLTGRLLDTSVGVVVGLLVNLLVWPPLRDRAVWARAGELPHDLAEVLARMATGTEPAMDASETESWITDLRRVDERVDEAWGLVRQARESSRLNPRRSRPAGLDDLVQTLHLLEQAVADSLSMARTLATSAEKSTPWDKAFRTSWRRLLAETAEAVTRHDEQGLRQVRLELAQLAEELSTDTLAGSAWYEYGGLLLNLRNVVTSLTQVTEWTKGSARRDAAGGAVQTFVCGPATRGTRSGMDTPLPEHQRPTGVSDETVSALGKLSEALEAVEVARGHLYAFHRLCGTADLTLGEAVHELRGAGHTDLAVLLDRELVGRNVLEGRWSFQLVEEYDETYYALFKELEARARDELVQGRRHLHEAEMKEDRRTHGARGHEATPDDQGPQGSRPGRLGGPSGGPDEGRDEDSP